MYILVICDFEKTVRMLCLPIFGLHQAVQSEPYITHNMVAALGSTKQCTQQ